ncbi:UNVERIFIED_CONTAM: hypothetical protein RF648_05210 [Kocuria sp. CPCC 205274]
MTEQKTDPQGPQVLRRVAEHLWALWVQISTPAAFVPSRKGWRF